jgi:hypothetical protein
VLLSLMAVLDAATIGQFVPTIFQLVLTKLMATKSQHYPRLVVVFLCTFAQTYGGPLLYSSLEGMQAGMTSLIVSQVMDKHLPLLLGTKGRDMATLIAGGSKIMADTPLGQVSDSADC